MLLTLLQLDLGSSGPPPVTPLVSYALKATVGGGGAHNAPLSIAAGDSFALVLPLLTPSGAQPTLISPSAVFELFDTPFALPGAGVILTKSTANGEATLAQILGAWTLTVDFASVDTLTAPSASFYWQAQIDDGAGKATIADGQIQISANLIG